MTTRITIGSVRGGPGVTTTSLLVARCLGDALVVEADPNGGTVATTFDLGREPGLTTFAGHDPEPLLWRSHAQSASGVPVLVGPDAPEAARALWRTSGDRLERALAACDVGSMVLDAGRIGALAPPLARSSALVLLLVRPVAEDLVTLTHLLPRLHEAMTGRVALVGVGDGPYDLDHTGLGVGALGHLPDDSKAATALLAGQGPKAVRTSLGRAVVGLADTASRAARVQGAFAAGVGS